MLPKYTLSYLILNNRLIYHSLLTVFPYLSLWKLINLLYEVL